MINGEVMKFVQMENQSDKMWKLHVHILGGRQVFFRKNRDELSRNVQELYLLWYKFW